MGLWDRCASCWTGSVCFIMLWEVNLGGGGDGGWGRWDSPTFLTPSWPAALMKSRFSSPSTDWLTPFPGSAHSPRHNFSVVNIFRGRNGSAAITERSPLLRFSQDDRWVTPPPTPEWNVKWKQKQHVTSTILSFPPLLSYFHIFLLTKELWMITFRCFLIYNNVASFWHGWICSTNLMELPLHYGLGVIIISFLRFSFLYGKMILRILQRTSHKLELLHLGL